VCTCNALAAHCSHQHHCTNAVALCRVLVIQQLQRVLQAWNGQVLATNSSAAAATARLQRVRLRMCVAAWCARVSAAHHSLCRQAWAVRWSRRRLQARALAAWTSALPLHPVCAPLRQRVSETAGAMVSAPCVSNSPPPCSTASTHNRHQQRAAAALSHCLSLLRKHRGLQALAQHATGAVLARELARRRGARVLHKWASSAAAAARTKRLVTVRHQRAERTLRRLCLLSWRIRALAASKRAGILRESAMQVW
jgi:hypothetical protein